MSKSCCIWQLLLATSSTSRCWFVESRVYAIQLSKSVAAVLADRVESCFLVGDDLLGFFDGVDTSLLKIHKHRSLVMAFSAHSLDMDAVSRRITESHRRLWAKGLSGVHFDLVATHLVETLLELGVSQSLIDEVGAIVGPLRAIFEENAKLVTDIQKKKEITSTIPQDAPK